MDFIFKYINKLTKLFLKYAKTNKLTTKFEFISQRSSSFKMSQDEMTKTCMPNKM